jgi:SAM-dependent methyltransferase
MARYARENLGLSVQTGSFENFPSDEKFDLVTMIQVAAHFYNVPEAFSKAAKLLNVNGFLLIETWNKASLTARLLGKNWHEYSPPSVLHYFTPQNLTEFATKFGFVRAAQGRPAKWISGAHAKSLLLHKFGDSALKHVFKLVPDKINFPYPAEDLFWILFRKT